MFFWVETHACVYTALCSKDFLWGMQVWGQAQKRFWRGMKVIGPIIGGGAHNLPMGGS